MNKFWFIRIMYLRFVNLLLFYYLKCQKLLLNPTAPKKILFSNSKQVWNRLIKKGFRCSKHEVFFDKLTSSNSKKFDLIVPLTIQELKNKEIQKLLENNPIPVPSIESILLCDDKYQFNNTLISNGFEKFIPKIDDTHTYPYILKKKIDEFARNTHIIYGIQEEEMYSDILLSPEYFTQEFISGKYEYATHIIIRNKTIVHSLNMKYIFRKEISIKGKDESIKVICRSQYLNIFLSMLVSIDFEGLCCINYKVRNNTPYIIEINPRFGASLSPYFSLFV